MDWKIHGAKIFQSLVLTAKILAMQQIFNITVSHG
jgi:hypothetical protein